MFFLINICTGDIYFSLKLLGQYYILTSSFHKRIRLVAPDIAAALKN
jgi:hypothetical protein